MARTNRFRALSALSPDRLRREDSTTSTHPETRPCSPRPPPRTAAACRKLAAITLAALAASAQATAAPTWCADRCDQIVIDWNLQTHQAIQAAEGYRNPMAASRTLAMVHLAMHDAANAAEPRYRAYAYARAAEARPGNADAAVAAAVAAHDVLAALYPKQKDVLRAALDTTLLDAGPGVTVEQGRKIGAAAAAAIVARRAADGSQADEAYEPGNQPGRYQYTPGFDFLAAPHWRAVTPFTMPAPDQFRVAAAPALASARYAADFAEVKAIGSAGTDARRSAEQTQIAAYWYEFSDIGWNRIARTVSRSRPQDLWQRARTFALLNAVMADAYIAGWDSKMHHDFWRPVTAIRRAAEDGNPATTADAAWAPLLPTPPVQDHPSTHSALGAAAAVVLAHAFGSDRMQFTMASPSARPEAPSRSFASFSVAARENADSRVFAGVHFRFATAAGLRLGEQIGQQAVATILAPAR